MKMKGAVDIKVLYTAPNAPACMEKHLCAAQYKSGDTLLVGASSLTGRKWQGSVWIYSNPAWAPCDGPCKVGAQTEAGVTDVKWLTDKEFVFTSDSGALELWELIEDERVLVNRFTEYEHDDIATTVSAIGAKIAVTGSMDCTVKVWDLKQKTVVTTYSAHTKLVNCVACCPKNDTLFVSCGQDRRVLLWDMRKPDKPASRIDVQIPNCSPTTAAWHPDQITTVVIGDELGKIIVKDIRGAEPALVQNVHSRRVNRLAFSTHEASLLASISDDCSIAVMNSKLQEIFRDRQHQDFVKGVSWLYDNPDVVTTVGWDHAVLHHTVGSAPNSST